jgi:hypothetical protein
VQYVACKASKASKACFILFIKTMRKPNGRSPQIFVVVGDDDDGFEVEASEVVQLSSSRRRKDVRLVEDVVPLSMTCDF